MYNYGMDIDTGSTTYIMGNRKYWQNETKIARRLAQKYYWLWKKEAWTSNYWIRQYKDLGEHFKKLTAFSRKGYREARQMKAERDALEEENRRKDIDFASVLFAGSTLISAYRKLEADNARLNDELKYTEENVIDFGDQIWGLMYPDNPNGWTYRTQPIVHIREYISELKQDKARLRELIRQAQSQDEFCLWCDKYTGMTEICQNPDCPMFGEDGAVK